MLKKILFCVIMMSFSSHAYAAIKTQLIDYSSNGQVMEGYIAYDDAITTPRPGILIAHDWMGLGDFQKNIANKLAKEGYVAFAVDIYGKGIRPANADQAKELSTKYKNDRPLLQAHMKAAYDTLAQMKQVNPKEMLVMGYCFGGTAALELARTGVPLAGTVTFHGGLSNPNPDDAKNIKGRVLVMHGAADPVVPPAEVAGFKSEMEKAGIDFSFISYPGAVHAFTNPAAGNDPKKGMAYNAVADKASWEAFEHFLKEVFPQHP